MGQLLREVVDDPVMGTLGKPWQIAAQVPCDDTKYPGTRRCRSPRSGRGPGGLTCRAGTVTSAAGQSRKSGGHHHRSPWSGVLLAGNRWCAGGTIHNEPRGRVFTHSSDAVHGSLDRCEPW